MLWGGFAVSFFDVARRMALETALNKEEATEIAEMMRKSKYSFMQVNNTTNWPNESIIDFRQQKIIAEY